MEEVKNLCLALAKELDGMLSTLDYLTHLDLESDSDDVAQEHVRATVAKQIRAAQELQGALTGVAEYTKRWL